MKASWRNRGHSIRLPFIWYPEISPAFSFLQSFCTRLTAIQLRREKECSMCLVDCSTLPITMCTIFFIVSFSTRFLILNTWPYHSCQRQLWLQSKWPLAQSRQQMPYRQWPTVWTEQLNPEGGMGWPERGGRHCPKWPGLNRSLGLQLWHQILPPSSWVRPHKVSWHKEQSQPQEERGSHHVHFGRPVFVQKGDF